MHLGKLCKYASVCTVYQNENEEIEEYIENSGDTWETIKEKGVWKVRRNIENNVESEEETAVE